MLYCSVPFMCYFGLSLKQGEFPLFSKLCYFQSLLNFKAEKHFYEPSYNLSSYEL